MILQFKTDENLHPDLSALLQEHGHDAVTVWDQGLRGKPDSELAEVCRREGRVMVTLDKGFADIRAYPPEKYAGLIVLRIRQQSRRNVLDVFRRLLPLLESEPLAGRLWVVDEWSLRVREGQKISSNSE